MIDVNAMIAMYLTILCVYAALFLAAGWVLHYFTGPWGICLAVRAWQVCL